MRCFGFELLVMDTLGFACVFYTFFFHASTRAIRSLGDVDAARAITVKLLRDLLAVAFFIFSHPQEASKRSHQEVILRLDCKP